MENCKFDSITDKTHGQSPSSTGKTVIDESLVKNASKTAPANEINRPHGDKSLFSPRFYLLLLRYLEVDTKKQADIFKKSQLSIGLTKTQRRGSVARSCVVHRLCS